MSHVQRVHELEHQCCAEGFPSCEGPGPVTEQRGPGEESGGSRTTIKGGNGMQEMETSRPRKSRGIKGRDQKAKARASLYLELCLRNVSQPAFQPQNTLQKVHCRGSTHARETSPFKDGNHLSLILVTLSELDITSQPWAPEKVYQLIRVRS